MTLRASITTVITIATASEQDMRLNYAKSMVSKEKIEFSMYLEYFVDSEVYGSRRQV